MVAHIREDGEEQTVSAHLRATAEYAAQEGGRAGLRSVCRLIGLLHDIGKNTVRFEDYIRKAAADPKSVRRGEVNHSSAGGKYIFDTFYRGGSYEGLTAQLLAWAVVSHHGMTDCLNPEGEDKFGGRIHPKADIFYEEAIQNSRDMLKMNEIKKLFCEAVGEITNFMGQFREISREMNCGNETMLFLAGCLERFLLSVLVDADRTDTASFMNGLVSKKRSSEELKEIWGKCLYNLETYLKELSKGKGEGKEKEKRIGALRKSLSEQCKAFALHPDGIYCLPVPTGGGKTLASLRYALSLAVRMGKEHIFYIAPFLSILEQNADEYRKALGMGEMILEHHSNLVTGRESQEELNQYELLADSWTSPIIMTTMVQLLNVMFSERLTCVRRMHQLKNAVIIVDEIQALPVKCISMFNTMLNFLSHCLHTTVILCSATQPLLGSVEKRLLYGKPETMIADVKGLALDFKRVSVEDKTVKGGYTTQQLADFILERLDQDMLVILNTKRAVRSLYETIEKQAGNDIYLVQLTTYMCPEHRSRILKEIKKRLGKERVLCISTQLIEAGVDISFQCVVRSLAGLDSIAQAAGRCNRNGKLPLGFVYIVNMKDENTGSLPDIALAKENMEQFLEEFWRFRDRYEGDLLLPAAMERYYELYFFARKGEMNYSTGGDTSLYGQLSSNREARGEYLGTTGREYGLQLAQSFRTAGSLFEVIGSQTVGLLVPYQEAREEIQKLRKMTDPGELRGQLRKLQRYTVNIMEQDAVVKGLLSRGAIDNSLLDGSILILEEGFYDEGKGISDTLADCIF